jgi:predicted ABC-type transport system involved in lysophospholipase L1 biosynthesis ATPase subunit
MALMRTLNRAKGSTFVIVTHDPGIGAQCDRIVRMHDGEVVDHAVPVHETPLLAVR